ncbi:MULTISPECIES: hypothetical protein [unclassified Clostridium]|uniref:hypothetical protein n=1 Tax=unclassified Clostridium TaxID=2614128 RepID=UPI0025BE21A3|nr:hypothetical protein [Clostridium sp.]MCI6693482.1 hypothetical protein [Clostridium sp.]MDY2630924.1 hypothetical protein [Clostridium sp.]MDY4252946.1 hypothetical protein [Clostridium sp.]MDY6226643.1 hypothetical protein [Clostridium sp.]
MNLINSVYLKCSEQWWKSDRNFKLDMKKYTNEEKKNKEKNLDKYIDLIIKKINEFPKEDNKKENWKKEFNEIIDNYIESEKETFKLGIINKDMKDDFFKSTKNFIKKAKEFEKNLTYKEIGQAMRNIWIVNILQVAFGEKVQLSKGAFGYSMLYPYTDNYLDNTEINNIEKNKFNNKLEKRLKGEDIKGSNSYENSVYKLVSYIEDEFERDNYTEIYKALLSIHKGQIKSLKQQDCLSIPYEEDILGISIEKGGSSVLVDGFLTKGKMNKDEISFCIFYGFSLQLADDLQDIKCDINNKHITIMSQLAPKYKLDKIANKLINFTIKFLEEEHCFKGENILELKELIKTNCIMLILVSVVLSKEFFSAEYVKVINEYLPFSIKYIENIKVKLRKKFKKIEFEDAINYILEIN